MNQFPKRCPDCDGESFEVHRREFLKTAGVAAAGLSVTPLWAGAVRAEDKAQPAESYVKKLYESLTDAQRKEIWFEWDYVDSQRGLLRTRVSNNWHITKPTIESDFFTKDQKELIRAIYERIYSPDWVKRIDKQLQDDAGGYGKQQNVAIFGMPGTGKFQFVMTGRHLTVRCDGDSADHVAFGGPVFYGHAASGFNEKPDHPGNVFWHQALEANKVFEMLDGKQRKQALVARTPAESAVAFRGPDGPFPGIPVSELSGDQKEQLQKTLHALLEPYRDADRSEAMKCLQAQGGLDKLSLAFYQQGDLGDDGVWDNWRLEGPSFVWYFRGAPHVHTWVNVADSHRVETNAAG